MRVVSIVHDFHVGLEGPCTTAAGAGRRALLLACTEACLPPMHLADRLWACKRLVRTPGNLVPALDAGGEGAAASIAAALVGGVDDLVVCGHYPCGVMGALLAPERTGGPDGLAGWHACADRTRTLVEGHYGHLRDEARLQVAVQENVLVQLESLMAHPAVAAALAAGAMRLHGWVHDARAGRMLTYAAGPAQFVPLRAPLTP